MSKNLLAGCLLLLLIASCGTEPKRQGNMATRPISPGGPILKSEFIFVEAPFRSCHASTLAQTPNGLVAAWFGGKQEGSEDVSIWISRFEQSRWSPPMQVTDGLQPDGKRFPTWNPVLFQPKEGPLLLFCKAGPSPSRWWGVMLRSGDGGKTWGDQELLPRGFLGPIKNKPVQLADGSILCGSSTEHEGWRVHMERTSDLGKTWTKTAALNDGKEFGAIQPTILQYGGQRLQILCRSRQGNITDCWSEDGGKTWRPMKATELPNPNSGIDAVTLKDGRQLVIYNHNTKGHRYPLNLATSTDGKSWKAGPVLETEPPGEYSYPAIIQTSDGLVHATYTWKRQRIKHVVLDPTKF
ncbi:MAG TPA: sialidase family protein [Candidatus Saccharimonadales bacterium]|nr:sialidase family protein [Candidatus Saccharimonadales bacterium]